MITSDISLNFDISIENCFENLKPHPKFAGCSFENYIPDERFPSQTRIKELLKEQISKLNSEKNNKQPKQKRFSFFKKKESEKDRLKNIYIDGGYGVGKTHLLSAFYNEANCKKAFMSFSEMNYFFNYLGINECIERFSKLRLLLIDEFELDDPATTRLIAMFFEKIGESTLIITTSNTLPSDLGKMRFQADEFKREMGIIANTFEVVVVDGEDYRKKNKLKKEKVISSGFYDFYESYSSFNKAKFIIKFEELMPVLEDNHPFRYFIIPDSYDAIFIEDLKPFPLLNGALRFTHLVDQCYYYNTQLFIKSDSTYDELFSAEMLESCFQKKLKRCLSRLNELSVFFKD
jgi:cell division protein ZapE